MTALLVLGSLTFVAGQGPGTAGYASAGPVDIRYFAPAALNNSQSGLVLQMPPNSDTDPNAVFMNPTYGLSMFSHSSQGVSRSTLTLPPPTMPGVNSVPTFFGAFSAEAGVSQGKDFHWIMMGNDPAVGGTTTIPAPVVEVSLQLLNADGSVFKTVPFVNFEGLFLNSPNFQNSTYKSSPTATQYQDAVQRASFNATMNPNWHTILNQTAADKVTITVPFFVNVQLKNGNVIQARSYFTGTAGDGNTFTLMLSPLFNFFFDNLVVNEINLGNFVTGGMNITAWPNVFLFNLNTNNPNVPGGCCVLGFHTFFEDGGVVPQDRWVTAYASWISPGIFGGGFQDVTAVSHELGEAFDDPFVGNATPNWQFPGVPANAKVCQANLEIGDPIEVLANAVTPVTLGSGFTKHTYHPQTLVLLPWFFMGATSNALDGAFSFPDETALPNSAVP
ncbi:MAG TPA: hypothetical protein VKS01_09285, partial [Bryobacteraceae bacterium]|nr:hypothetical protein [Bryobacteraceae bacterium]